jgi:hypothetical protein
MSYGSMVSSYGYLWNKREEIPCSGTLPLRSTLLPLPHNGVSIAFTLQDKGLLMTQA